MPGDERLLSPEEIRGGVRLACLHRARPSLVVGVPSDLPAPPPVAAPPRPAARGRRRGGKASLALAADLGTTTIAVALVDRATGEVAGRGSAPNGQWPFGGDVVSRASLSEESKADYRRLRRALQESLREAALDACRDGGVPYGSLSGGAAAANPAMACFLLGAPLSTLFRAPFSLPAKGGTELPASALGWPGRKDGAVYLFPLAHPTVGGDAVAGAVLCGLDRPGGAELLVDVGTNTEMVVRIPRGDTPAGGKRAPRLLSVSAASGGAFEGAAISCGSRAVPGAVLAASFDGDSLVLDTLGGGEAKGLAGSALMDLCALLVAAGIVTQDGRMRSLQELPPTVPPGLAGRVLPGPPPSFLVARPRAGRPVTLTASDVRQYQLAKGAVRVALDLLLDAAGLEAREVERVHLLGAFGDGIREEAAFATGLFPEALRGKIAKGGNGSLDGAVEALRSPAFVRRAGGLARRLSFLSLPERTDFAGRFLASLSLAP
jgi:uncharacterized 2Fe-2S/4Fe-4S cluster protein (DUF4445 family)